MTNEEPLSSTELTIVVEENATTASTAERNSDIDIDSSPNNANGTTTTNVSQSTRVDIILTSVADRIQEDMGPKSKAYILHRTNGTARPHPLYETKKLLQEQYILKRRRRNAIARDNDDDDNDINNDNDDIENENGIIANHDNDNDNDVNDENENCDCEIDDRNCDCEVCTELYRKPPWRICHASIWVYWFAKTLEQNWFCESFGKLGCIQLTGASSDNFYTRRRILIWGLVADCISLVVGFVVCFSISLQYNILTSVPFTTGIAYLENTDLPIAQFWIGLRGMAIQHYKGSAHLLNTTVSQEVNPTQDETYVVRFDEMCVLFREQVGIESYFLRPGSQCEACSNESPALMASVILSFLFTMPGIRVVVLRMYPQYDLNCEKFMGALFGFGALIFALHSCFAYTYSCSRGFNTDIKSIHIPFFMNGTIAMSQGEEADYDYNSEFDYDNSKIVNVSYKFKAGIGIKCLVAATFLKVFGIVCSFIVPTPEISHSRLLQDEYEKLYGDNNDNNNDDDDDDDNVDVVDNNDIDNDDTNIESA